MPSLVIANTSNADFLFPEMEFSNECYGLYRLEVTSAGDVSILQRFLKCCPEPLC